MQLQNIKQSILTLPPGEVMEIHREVRRQRWIPKQVKKSSKAGTVIKSKKAIQGNADQIKQLLMLLGEDV